MPGRQPDSKWQLFGRGMGGGLGHLSILIQHRTLQLRATFCSRNYLESIKWKSLQSEIILKLSQLPNLPLHSPSRKNGVVNKNSVPKTFISMFIYNILLLLICANGPVVVHINARTLAGESTDTATLTRPYRVIASKLFAFARHDADIIFAGDGTFI